MSWPILPDGKMISKDAWGNAIIVDKPMATATVLTRIANGEHMATARNRSMSLNAAAVRESSTARNLGGTHPYENQSATYIMESLGLHRGTHKLSKVHAMMKQHGIKPSHSIAIETTLRHEKRLHEDGDDAMVKAMTFPHGVTMAKKHREDDDESAMTFPHGVTMSRRDDEDDEADEDAAGRGGNKKTFGLATKEAARVFSPEDLQRHGKGGQSDPLEREHVTLDALRKAKIVKPGMSERQFSAALARAGISAQKAIEHQINAQALGYFAMNFSPHQTNDNRGRLITPPTPPSGDAWAKRSSNGDTLLDHRENRSSVRNPGHKLSIDASSEYERVLNEYVDSIYQMSQRTGLSMGVCMDRVKTWRENGI